MKLVALAPSIEKVPLQVPPAKKSPTAVIKFPEHGQTRSIDTQGKFIPEKVNDIVAPEEPEEDVWLKSGCCPETFQKPVYSILASWSSTIKVLMKREGKNMTLRAQKTCNVSSQRAGGPRLTETKNHSHS